MSKHTPGPWTYKATAGDHDFSVYPETTGRDVALVRDFNEANARLIAAAPDLLTALRSAMLDVEDWADPDGEYQVTDDGLEALARELRAAIAKAEGSAE